MTLLFLLLSWNNSYSQSGNIIIQINDILLTSEITVLNVKTELSPYTFSAEYIPGKLTLSEKAWEIIKNDSVGNFKLSFNYQTFKRKKVKSKNFTIELSKYQLTKNYLIINIYDFRNRKYRKWYGPYTTKEYLIELIYPNGPFYPRYKYQPAPNKG